jgi:hypothetical protein
MHNLEYVCRWIPPFGYPNAVCNVSIALLKSGRVARVHPENPCFWRSFSHPVGVFDGELRLPCQMLVVALQGTIVLPDTAQADKRRPRARYGTSLVDLIEECLAIDEVGVAAEGHVG